MRNLNLHAGGDLQTRDQLATLLYPEPQGSRHVIRPFLEDILLLDSALDEYGYRITDEAIGVKFNAENQASQFFGALEVRPKALEGEYIPADGKSLVVGIRGSSDQSLTRGIVAGSNVFVCSNLAFSGELTNVSTKQTLNINDRIEGLVREAISKLPQEAALEDKRFDAYKNYALSLQNGDALLIDLVRQNILNVSDLQLAIKEWTEPRYEEHLVHGRSIYTLFNAVTEAFKPRGNSGRANIPGAWNRGLPLTRYLDKGIGLIH